MDFIVRVHYSDSVLWELLVQLFLSGFVESYHIFQCFNLLFKNLNLLTELDFQQLMLLNNSRIGIAGVFKAVTAHFVSLSHRVGLQSFSKISFVSRSWSKNLYIGTVSVFSIVYDSRSFSSWWHLSLSISFSCCSSLKFLWTSLFWVLDSW